MYIINITVNSNVAPEQHDKMFAEHAAWFKKHFEKGNFVMLGPYTDTEESAGVIFAVTKSRAELDEILAEDCYYPSFAQYEVREFAPKLIAKNIQTFTA